MLKNHLVIALRHLFANKGYFFINTLGLSTGIACSLLVFLFVRQEWTFDTFHEKADRIYRVNVSGLGFDGTPFRTAITPIPLAPALKRQFPGVGETVMIRSFGGGLVVRVGDDTF
ncbi:MAG: ABC transporter permease, partial [Gemmatimonadetes bacterium]|nr:ABC transporter permease [Gemmatimonadota bacterium]